jgi:hypothetical protein
MRGLTPDFCPLITIPNIQYSGFVEKNEGERIKVNEKK